MSDATITPTAAECRIIRKCAQQAAGRRRVELQPGIRHNTDDPSRPHSFNLRLVSDDPDWDDTDLFDHTDWDAFRKGFAAAPGGRAEVDFYVYSTGDDGELETNVQAVYDAGRLVRVTGTRHNETPLWTAS